MAATQFNSNVSQAASAALNAASATGFSMMDLAYNRQRQQMTDTDARNAEQRRIVETDRAFQAEQQQAGIANSQREQALQLEQRNQAFTENKYKDMKTLAANQAAEVRKLTASLGLPPVSDVESLQVVTSLIARKDELDQKKSILADTTALRAGLLEAGRITDPAARLNAVRDAFANNPNAKVDDALMKHAVTLVNRDRLLVNQGVFNKIATASSLSDLRAVQSLPGFSEWYSDEANRSVWKERFAELEKAEPAGKSRDVIKISSDGTTLWDNGVPAVKVEDRQVRDANGKVTTITTPVYRDRMGNIITVQQYNQLLNAERGKEALESTDEGDTAEDGGSLYPTSTNSEKGAKSPVTASKDLISTFYASF